MDISVIVCCYKPKWDKVEKTLDSIICQQNVEFEIVVTDDGSQDNLFDKIREYFVSKKFNNYVLSALSENGGTVKNVLNGLNKSSGDYIKLISPGDLLVDETTLRNWLDFLKSSGKKWSFSDVICIEDESHKPVSRRAYPLDVEVHRKKDELNSRWNYVVLMDIAVGAAILIEKQASLNYVSKIAGSVKYVEDSTYRMMMFDGVVGAYYPVNAVYYEVGAGISNSGDDKWSKLIRQDLVRSENILSSKENIIKYDNFQRCMLKGIEAKNESSKIKMIFKMPKKHLWLKWILRKNFNMRMTSVSINNEGVK